MMKINELPPYLENALHYPIERLAVIDQIGHQRIDAPDPGDSVTIGTSLEKVNELSYESGEELFHAILGTLDDAYIGRKYYDDRGSNPLQPREDDELAPNTSF